MKCEVLVNIYVMNVYNYIVNYNLIARYHYNNDLYHRNTIVSAPRTHIISVKVRGCAIVHAVQDCRLHAADNKAFEVKLI